MKQILYKLFEHQYLILTQTFQRNDKTITHQKIDTINNI